MIIYLQMIESDADKSKFEIIYHEYKGLMYHISLYLLTTKKINTPSLTMS